MRRNINHPICEECGSVLHAELTYCPCCGTEVSHLREQKLKSLGGLDLDNTGIIEGDNRPRIRWNSDPQFVVTASGTQTASTLTRNVLIDRSMISGASMSSEGFIDPYPLIKPEHLEYSQERSLGSREPIIIPTPPLPHFPLEGNMSLEQIAQLASDFGLMDEVVEAVKTGNFKALIDKLKWLRQQNALLEGTDASLGTKQWTKMVSYQY